VEEEEDLIQDQQVLEDQVEVELVVQEQMLQELQVLLILVGVEEEVEVV
jgi:hypothetical protein